MVTARDAAAFMAPASIRYGRELGVMMLVFITGWAYAVVSPLVVVVSAIYFMSSWIVWRWQVVYVYVRCYEGGGSLWRSIVACIMLCLYTFVFFTSCVFVAKSAFYQAAFVLPLAVIITAFWCVALLPCRNCSMLTRCGGRRPTPSALRQLPHSRCCSVCFLKADTEWSMKPVVNRA